MEVSVSPPYPHASASDCAHRLITCRFFLCSLHIRHDALVGGAVAVAMKEWQEKKERDGEPQDYVSGLVFSSHVTIDMIPLGTQTDIRSRLVFFLHNRKPERPSLPVWPLPL